MKKILTSSILSLALTVCLNAFALSSNAAERTYGTRTMEAKLVQALIWWTAENGGFTMQDRISSAQFISLPNEGLGRYLIRISYVDAIGEDLKTKCLSLGSWEIHACADTIPSTGWTDFSADAKLLYQTLFDNIDSLDFLAGTMAGGRVRIQSIKIDDAAADAWVFTIQTFLEHGDYFPTGVKNAVVITRKAAPQEPGAFPQFTYTVNVSTELPPSWGYSQTKPPVAPQP